MWSLHLAACALRRRVILHVQYWLLAVFCCEPHSLAQQLQRCSCGSTSDILTTDFNSEPIISKSTCSSATQLKKHAKLHMCITEAPVVGSPTALIVMLPFKQGSWE